MSWILRGLGWHDFHSYASQSSLWLGHWICHSRHRMYKQPTRVDGLMADERQPQNWPRCKKNRTLSSFTATHFQSSLPKKVHCFISVLLFLLLQSTEIPSVEAQGFSCTYDNGQLVRDLYTAYPNFIRTGSLTFLEVR